MEEDYSWVCVEECLLVVGDLSETQDMYDTHSPESLSRIKRRIEKSKLKIVQYEFTQKIYDAYCIIDLLLFDRKLLLLT